MPDNSTPEEIVDSTTEVNESTPSPLITDGDSIKNIMDTLTQLTNNKTLSLSTHNFCFDHSQSSFEYGINLFMKEQKLNLTQVAIMVDDRRRALILAQKEVSQLEDSSLDLDNVSEDLVSASVAPLEYQGLDVATMVMEAYPLVPEFIGSDALPVILDKYHFAEMIGSTVQFLSYLIKNKHNNYRKFYIIKGTNIIVNEKDPNLKLREIVAPSPSLKSAQRGIMDIILNKLPKHPANFAYMKGRSIKDAGISQVVGGREDDVTILTDFKDFFPSHSRKMIMDFLVKAGLQPEVARMIANLCTYNHKMVQGSPTSPLLSIVLNYELDTKIQKLASDHNLVYSRYSDDMAFTGADRDTKYCYDFIKQLKYLIQNDSMFTLNEAKIKVLRNRKRRYESGWIIKYDNDETRKSIIEAIDVPLDFAVSHKEGESNIYLPSKANIYEDFMEQFRGLDLIIKQAFKLMPGSSVEPIYFYTCMVRKWLGMHMFDGVKYPRRKYKKMRAEAMMYALGLHPKPARFRGKLSHMKLIDPVKYAKIEQVIKDNVVKLNKLKPIVPKPREQYVANHVIANPSDPIKEEAI